MAEPLDARLADALDDARRTYAAFRPEVAAYLHERGYVPTAAALPPSDDREGLLTHLFRLHLETVGTRMFGVSTDAWRDNPAYPDRYFPTVWLDVVPKVLHRLPPERRLPTLAALFNLGENIGFAARAMGASVAAALAHDLDAIVEEGVEIVALGALADLGVVPREAAGSRRASTKTQVTRFAPLTSISTAEADPLFVPFALSMEGATCLVFDWTRPLALAYSLVGTAPQLIGRKSLPAPKVAARGLAIEAKTDAGMIAVGLDGVVTLTEGAGAGGMGERRRLGAIDPRGVVAIAASSSVLAVARRFSQRVELIAIGS